jgi:hypothetical protein
MQPAIDVETSGISKKNARARSGIVQMNEPLRFLHEIAGELFASKNVRAIETSDRILAFDAEHPGVHRLLSALLPIGPEKRLAVGVRQSPVDRLVAGGEEPVGPFAQCIEVVAGPGIASADAGMIFS